jgi:hypothetical protein
MQSYISTGRSTPGVAQKNEFDLSLTPKGKPGKKLNSQGKTKTEHNREMALASDAAFD